MTFIKSTLAAIFVSTAFAASAIAQESVDTAFSYNTHLSPVENYKAIEATADAACDALHTERSTSFQQAHLRAKKKCRAEMIEAAIEAFDRQDLTAIHTNTEHDKMTVASLN